MAIKLAGNLAAALLQTSMYVLARPQVHVYTSPSACKYLPEFAPATQFSVLVCICIAIHVSCMYLHAITCI